MPARSRRESRPAQTRLTFEACNGWRGPGALLIAVAHLGVATDSLPSAVIRSTALLVDMFFVLSGLVIAHAYAVKLSHARNIPEYIVRRFGRIWPVQAAALMVLVGYEALKLGLGALGRGHFGTPPFSRTGGNLVEAIPTNLLLVHSLGLHDRETWNFPSWSLSVEFACYVSFAGACLMARPYRRALSVLTILASLAVLIFVAPDGMRSTYDYGVFRCLAGFFTGTLCYEFVSADRIPPKRWPTLTEIAALALVGLWLTVASTTVAGFAAPFVIALFLLTFVGRPGLVARLLATPRLQNLADLSFSLYMVHAVVMIAVLAALRAAGRALHLDLFVTVANVNAPASQVHRMIDVIHLPGLPATVALFAIYLGLVYGVALLAYRFVEVPGRDLFTRWAKALPKRAAAVPRGAGTPVGDHR